jgi:hypothetical protein
MATITNCAAAGRTAVGLCASHRLRPWNALADQEQRRLDAIAKNLPNLASERASAESGSKGEWLYNWALTGGWEKRGWSFGLLVRRSIEGQLEHAYYWFYAPKQKTTLEALVRVAGQP